jgi:ATP synthase protein I
MAEGENGEEEDRVLRARLEKLSGALERQRKTSQKRRGALAGNQPSDGSGSVMAMAMRAGGEFVAAIIAGGFIGWVLDAWLGTKPGFLIAFFFLGVAAGVMNVIRATSPSRDKQQAAGGEDARAKRNEDEKRGG